MVEIWNLNRNPNGPPRYINVLCHQILRESDALTILKIYVEGCHPELGAVSCRGWQQAETIMLLSIVCFNGQELRRILRPPDPDAIQAEIEAGIRKPR